jgi:hypothetical protein
MELTLSFATSKLPRSRLGGNLPPPQVDSLQLRLCSRSYESSLRDSAGTSSPIFSRHRTRTPHVMVGVFSKPGSILWTQAFISQKRWVFDKPAHPASLARHAEAGQT